MIAVSEGPPQDTKRSRLAALLAWLERGPVFTIRVRPHCPIHGVEMVTRKSEHGISHCYCPCPNCSEKWKGRATREV